MSYRRVLPNGLVVRATLPADAQQLEALQNAVFPTLDDSQRLKAPHYLKHIELFPRGQFVAADGERVVAMTTAIRLSDAFLHRAHTFNDVIQGGFCTSHDPRGEWLYGVDMGTHAQYRGRGLARALYVARHQTVRELGLRGQYTMGMISGYGSLAGKLSAEQYYAKLLKGDLNDATVNAQMKIGFEPHGLVPEYLTDPSCKNYCVRLILPAEKAIADEDNFYI